MKEYFSELTAEQRAQTTQNVQWLIDSEKTLREYLAFFHDRGLKFAVNVEIDVGLKRGGAETLGDFEKILSLIEANSDQVRFEGLMGYDGHVAHAPAPDLFGPQAVRRAFGLQRHGEGLSALHRALKTKHPRLYAQATTSMAPAA